MAEPATEPTNEPTTEPTGDGAAQTTDWESKYREAIQHSRTWEYRSKENYSQVQALTAELDKLKATKPDEQIAAANQRADEAEAQLASYKHDAEVNSWKAAAAKETGVPAELLNGDTEDSIKASAKALADWAAKRPIAPRFSNPAGTPQTRKPADATAEAIRAALFGN